MLIANKSFLTLLLCWASAACGLTHVAMGQAMLPEDPSALLQRPQKIETSPNANFGAYFQAEWRVPSDGFWGQDVPPPTLPQRPTAEEEALAADLTMFSHPEDARYLLAAQANIIFQAHPGFHSPYEGAHSLLARGEYKTSLLGTIYTGYELNTNPRFDTDLIFDVEEAVGRGVSEALGLAGFTNLDVVRNPNLGLNPYLARYEVHQTIGLTPKLIDAARTEFALATKVPERRLEFRLGKMGLPDVLDVNNPGSDSHLQFLNWTVDNNGAWDYAADTRGYTYAFVAEYDDLLWSARYALALMPTVANGIDLQWNLRLARGENYEFELRKTPFALLPNRILAPKYKGTMRVLAYLNHANMGDYREANIAALNQRVHGDPSATPDITAHPFGTTIKYGTGLSFEQALPANMRVFGRFGWNDGKHESYAYTEDEQTFELGGDIAGNLWSRPDDKVGIAGVTNAIKRAHQEYLGLGGLGFLLGDGALSYAREDILETYYNAHNWRGLYSAFDIQLIAHPGYNQARGPVAMFSARTHIDF